MKSMGISTPLEEFENKQYFEIPNCNQNFDMVYFNPVNKLMKKSENKQPAPSP